MVVVGGKCPTPCKKGGGIVRAGKMSGENMSEGKMSRGKCPNPLLGAVLERVTLWFCGRPLCLLVRPFP